MTFAINTQATNADGLAAKIRLYHHMISQDICDDDDGYMLSRINQDIAALSVRRAGA